MNIFGFNDGTNPNDIYFYRSTLPKVDSSKLFSIAMEGVDLRVKNDNVNCLFGNLTQEAFDKCYNDFRQYLNLDFSPLTIDGKTYQLTDAEQDCLEQKIITSLMFYYTVNNWKIKIKRSDFTHPNMANYTTQLLDNKYGIDTNLSMSIGAKVLRQDLEKYRKTVKFKREYDFR